MARGSRENTPNLATARNKTVAIKSGQLIVSGSGGIAISGSSGITNLGTTTDKPASETYVSTQISNLVASAPSTLNTLDELAAALGDDANFASTVTTSIGTKLTKTSNLSDLSNAATARTNLGLGTAATTNATAYATSAQGTKADTAHGWGNHASAGYLTSESDTLASVTGRGASTSTAVTFNSTVSLGNAADLRFVDLAGTFPTTGKGFDWTLNNDGARIYAIQPATDSIDLVFQLRDNATTNDRFVFHVQEWQGASYDKYPLIIRGGTEFDLVSSALYTNGTLRLSNAGVLQNVSGNISMFTNNSGYLTSVNNGNWSGADLSLANGGTGASLSDPNADRILFWDDSAGAMTWLTAGSNLTISGTTISSTNTTYSVGDGGLTEKNFTSALKTKLDGIAASANNYSLPTATAAVLGGVKIGSGISISSGVISANSQTDNNFTTAYKNKIDGIAAGATANTGTVTSVATGTGLTGGTITTTGTISLSHLGFQNLTDPNADRIAFWDDSAGTFAWLAAGSNITISGTTISATNTTYSVGDGGLTQVNFTTTRRDKLDGIASGADNYGSWTISDGTTTEAIASGNTLIVRGAGASTAAYDADSNTLTINSTNTTYSVGDGGLTEKNFTTALKTKLDGIAASANNYSLPTATAAVLGGVKIGSRISISSGVISADLQTDNNFTSALKTKLDGIAASANNYVHPTTAGNKHIPAGGSAGQFLKYSADGTAVWAADNNTTYSVGDNGLTEKNFTSALNTKLSGIEAGATADQSASEILTLLKTVDGAGSGLDADLLDGNSSTAFATAAQGTKADTAHGWGNHASAGYLTSVTNISGNAATATTLQTARTIGGVSFNGSANINLPGVNTAGNQNTSGNAASATILQTTRTINGTNFNGSGNITTSTWGTARTLTIGNTGKSVNGGVDVSWSLAEIGAQAAGSYATSNHKYHVFNNGEYYFDSYGQGNYLRLFTQTANFDQIRFQTFQNIESSSDGTTWTSWSGGDAMLRVLLDGREDTSYSLPLDKRGIRFEINRNSGWPTTALIVWQETWSGLGRPNSILNIETWDGSAWIMRDQSVFNSSTTSNGYGTHLKVSTNLHNGQTKIRVTVIYDDWSGNVNYPAYSTVPLVNFMLLSNYSGSTIFPYTWDYYKNFTVGGNLYASGGNSSNWNTAYGWGNHASAGYASTSYVDTAVSNLVDTAPDALNTLNELAAALGDDPNFATTISNSIGTKLAKASNLSDLSNATTARTNLGLGSLATLSSVNAATITDNSVGAAELNVSGNGTTAQYLRSDGDGTFTWATPPDTTYSVFTATANGLAPLSGGGTDKYLRADGTWVVPPNTTYSVGDGGLTQKNFTTTLYNKLNGIAASADNYGSWTISDGVNTEGIGSGATLIIRGAGASVTEYDAASNTLTINSTNTTYSVGDGGLTQVNFTTAFRDKLNGIAASANNYSLPTATAAVLGGVKIGSRISISSGVISADSQTDNNFTTAYKNKIDGIAASANNYSLPVASTTVLGGVKAGTNISIDVNGVISSTNTTYSVGNGGLTEINFTSALNTKLAGIAASANNYSLPEATATTRGGIELFSNTDQAVAANTVSATAGRTYGIQLNSAGQAVVNVPWTDNNTTYTAGTGLTLSGTQFSLTTPITNNNQLTNGAGYTTNTGTVTSIGTNSGLTGGTITTTGTIGIATNGVTATHLNVSGNGTTAQYLRSDGDGSFTWATPTNTTYSVGDGGLTQVNFTTARRDKLDGISDNADDYGKWWIRDRNLADQFSVTSNSGVSFRSAGATEIAFDPEFNQVIISSTDTNTDTTYTAGSGLSLSGTTFSHSDTSSQSSVNNSGRTFIQDITLDTYGHIIGIVSATDADTYTGTVTSVATSGGLTGGTITSTGTISISSDARPNANQTFGNSGGEYIYFDNSNALMRFYMNSSERIRLYNDGTTHFYGDVIAYSSTLSDARLKDNVVTIENALDKVKRLRGVEYDWNSGSRKGQHDIGVIAQEVEEVLPEIVREQEMPFIDENVYKTVDYEKMVGVLIEAMKEQQGQIEALRAEVDALKNK